MSAPSTSAASASSEPAWAREAPPPSWAPLERAAHCEVLVIGGGLSGLALTAALQARGVDTLLVEAQSAGAGASARNAGFVLITHPWDYASIRSRVGAARARAVLALARRTHARIERDFGEAVQHRRSGSLCLTRAGDDADRRALEEGAELLALDGVPTRRVRVPEGLHGYDLALEIPEDGEIHPGRLVARLAAGVTRVARERIEALDLPAQTASTASGREIRFQRVVVATNAWASELLGALTPLVTPHRAQVLLTEPLPPTLSQPCYAGFGLEYFRQRSDGSVLLGGRRGLFRESEATAEASPSAEVQDALDAYLASHLPFARGARVVSRWAGIMGFSDDDLPLVGALPGHPHAHLLCGFTGHGLGLALACAEELATLLTEGEAPELPDALDPSRFSATLRAR